MPGARKRVVLLSVFVLVPWLGACFGGISVDSEPGPGYVIEVRNPHNEPMIVSYDDGTGVRLLGTVPPNGSARFVITRPASREISLTATDEGRTHTVNRNVVLQSGVVTEVSLGS